MEVLRVTEVQLTPASLPDRHAGLLGWIACVLNQGVRLDGITLRRTADGRLTLSFPERRDATGGRHPYFRPCDEEARRVLEGQIFGALGLAGDGGSRGRP